jgi:hypothetical protein
MLLGVPLKSDGLSDTIILIVEPLFSTFNLKVTHFTPLAALEVTPKEVEEVSVEEEVEVVLEGFEGGIDAAPRIKKVTNAPVVDAKPAPSEPQPRPRFPLTACHFVAGFLGWWTCVVWSAYALGQMAVMRFGLWVS